MTHKEIDEYKQTLKMFLNGYGEDVQNAIIIALTLLDRERAMKKKRGLRNGYPTDFCPICNAIVNDSYCPSCGHRVVN